MNGSTCSLCLLLLVAGFPPKTFCLHDFGFNDESDLTRVLCRICATKICELHLSTFPAIHFHQSPETEAGNRREYLCFIRVCVSTNVHSCYRISS